MKKHLSTMAAFVAVAACLSGCGESGTSSGVSGKVSANGLAPNLQMIMDGGV